MEKHTGGCHCKKVRYQVEMELKDGIDCNCSICSKRGSILAFVSPKQFTLLSGEDELTVYNFNTMKIDHLFCSTCGILSFGKGTDSAGNEMYAINLRCLDEVDLENITIIEHDGQSV